MVLRGIVAGCEIDGAIEFAALDFVSDGRCRSKRVAEKSADAMLLENRYGECGEFLGVEAGVVTYQDCGLGGLCFEVFGDGGDRETDGCEREIISDKPAPAGCSEFDWRNRQRWRSAHSGASVALQTQRAKRQRRRKWRKEKTQK